MSKVTQNEEKKATELGELLNRYGNVSTLGGQRAIVCNGYLPTREVLTAVGPVSVRVPKVRDRSGSGVKFNSACRRPETGLNLTT